MKLFTWNLEMLADFMKLISAENCFMKFAIYGVKQPKISQQ